MEDALQYGEYTNEEIRQINRARLFLQVETLSDVSNALTTELQKDLWSKTSMVHSQSTMLWPKQGAPGPQTQATWRKFLQRYTTQKSIHQLHSPLGNWTNLTRRTWAAYYSATNNSIHVQHRTGSLQYMRDIVLKQHRRHLELEDRELDRSEYPQDKEPVDYYPEKTSNRGNKFRHHAGISWSIRDSNQELRANLRKQDEESSEEDASKDDDHESQQDDEESTTASQHGHNKPAIPFWAYIETLPAWERNLLLSVVIFPEWDDIIDQEGTKILGVSDGGHKDDYGSFGLAIATNMEPKTNLVQDPWSCSPWRGERTNTRVWCRRGRLIR